MLEKLLTEIRSGGTFETGVLAARLGTTPELVQAMLEYLRRAGYIQPYRTCGDACGGCSLRKECHQPPSDNSTSNAIQLFVLADPRSDTGGSNTRPESV
ncbi:MAG: hypothetical protein Q8N46_07170 [Anaerolineales bacterium]|nr:hypothetical protein [Anaerolineales bacterium]